MNKFWLLAAAAYIAFSGTRPVAAGKSSAAPRDIGREVLMVFSAKCAVCHGPDLPKPKGRFGYVLNLQRLAGDTEKVIPPNPQESELWGLVERSEMPPAESPRGPLTNEQKEVIRTWIAAGAPGRLAYGFETTCSRVGDRADNRAGIGCIGVCSRRAD